MKKLLFVLIMLLALSVALVACGGTTDSSTDGTTEPTTAPSTDSSTVDSGTTDSSTTDSSTTDSSTTDSSTTDSSTTDSSTTDSSTTDSSTTDSSTTDSTKPDPKPEPDVEPEDPDKNIPDGKLTLAENGVSKYVVVYDDSDIRVTEFAEKFVNYMADTHKITLTSVGDSVGTDSEYCIYIGHVINTKRVRDKLNKANDFGACVSGNDYVLYATNSRLYEYLYEILTTQVLTSIRNGNWNTLPAKNFIYHSSDFAEKSYVDYVIEKNGGTLTQDILNSFFEDRTFVAEDGTVLKYRLYVPYDYDETQEYPFVTFMHGAGERGTENWGNMKHLPLKWFSMENSPFWDAIVMAPQCPQNNQWVDTPWKDGGYRVNEVPVSNEMVAVMEIIDMVEETFPTDLDRYYVAGLSMGGFATWDMIMRYTERFAAAVPICGGADYTQAYKLVDMPIYTLHDMRDGDVPCMGTKEMVVALETLGSDCIFYEELQGYGHNVWGYAGDKPEIWLWMFEQTREGR